MSETKKYEVSIYGDSYTLLSDEPETHVLKTAQVVDSLMQEIAQKARASDAKKIAALAALKLASNLLHIQQERANIQHEEQRLVDLIDQALV